MPRKLRIKLITPRMSLRPMDSELKRRMAPSLALLTLASLTPSPHEVYIEDENIHRIKFNDEPDLVGITVNVDTSYRAAEISEQYRSRGIKVIFGGIHASADPQGMLKHCDSVCIGEAENLWADILSDILKGELKSIYHTSRVTDLSKVPELKRYLIPNRNYLYDNIIVTSRGCPFKCEFCYNSCDYVVDGFRNKSIKKIIREIKSLKRKQVMIVDDNLIGNISWAFDFVEAIMPLNIVWHGAVSANIINHPGLIVKMAESGCRSLFIGFESINTDSLGSVKKKQNHAEKYEELINLLHDNNIMVNASLVFGFDHDTPATFPETLSWLIKNRVETMTAHILTPYPGTVLYKRLQKEGRITDTDLRNYNTANVVFQPRNMTASDLKNGYLSMYNEFYSLKNIIKRRPLKKSLIAPYMTFNLGYRKYGRITALIGKAGFMSCIGKIGGSLSYGIG